MSEPEELVSGEGDNRRTDPTAGPTTEPDSVVRPSAPTIQGDSDPGATPKKPVVIRTPVPPSAIDDAVPSLSTTTPTGRASPISTTLRSGGARTLIGSSLGRYEIIEELGHGGMATVYRARDPRLERDVALKVIHRHLRDNSEIAQRFRHEARAVAKLKHPSIVEIYDVPDVDDEERFLVAELVEGPSLRKWLQDLRAQLGHDSPGLVPPELAAALVLQVLSALGRAHQEGIVHRDVKPENILIAGQKPDGARESTRSSQRQSDPSRPAPVAKLTDFGIAKILDAQSMTSTGQILGSPAHMAPEQIESGDITPRVDIFATGVLFYELLTGQLPFDGKNPAQVIRRVLDGAFTPAERAAPTVGGRWSAIVAQMLARDPDRRPATVEEVESAIRAELDAMSIKEPDRELLEFVRDPRPIATQWGERMKPILLQRAIAARERGDVVGSAHDLNRALAYDPSDPGLVRAVTSMRTRERRMRGLKRALPIGVAALLVSGGTFGIVRYAQHRAGPTPIVSGSAAPEPTKSVSAPPVASLSAVARDAGVPSATVAILTTVPPVVTTAAVDAASTRRRVRFNIFPPGTYAIDNGPVHDSFTDPVQELSTGDHTIAITGRSGCCEPFTQKFRVEAGDGEQPQPFKLALKPAVINVVGVEGARVTVTRQVDGAPVESGPAPLRVVLTETQLPVTIKVEAGSQTKTENATLFPGSPAVIRFD